MADSRNPTQRLHGFIDAILLEQRRYQLWDQVLDQDYLEMQDHHSQHAEKLKTISNHSELCRVHESIFDHHQKMMKEHLAMARYCLRLLDRTKSEALSEEEVTREIEKLSRMYDMICLQHMKMDRERRQVLSEHRDYLRNNPDPDSVN